MKYSARIKKHFSAPPIILFLWGIVIFMGIFAVLRLLLLLSNYTQIRDIPLLVLFRTFLVGARFDIAVTLYTITPLFLVNYLLYLFDRAHWLIRVNTIYLSVFAVFYAFLGVAEIEFFKYFHMRLNAFFVNWEEDPGFVLKMVWESYPVMWYITPIFLLFGVLYWTIRKLHLKYYHQNTSQPVVMKVVVFLVIAPFMFLGIRGTISRKTPLRWGHAYFSKYNTANKLALNGIFTLINDILYQKKGKVNLQHLLEIEEPSEAYRVVREMMQDATGRVRQFPWREYTFQNPPQKYNVVILLLESFSDYGITRFEADGIPLFFNRIKHEGIYFPHFYSNGFHTYSGVFSSLFGMPNAHGKSILKRNEGQQEFSGILNILARHKYHGYFGVSHDPNFDNMAGFLRGNGIEDVISQFDFPQTEVLSTLGVADHKLFEKMHQRFAQSEEPFVGVILSTNNHGPWIIPEVPGKEFLSTFHYTDWALQYFLELASQEAYFKNTIFVITGDHGKAEAPLYDLDLQNTHIPCLIYNPTLIEPQRVQNICGHIDLTQIVLGVLKITYKTTNLGRDVLHLPNEFSGFALMQEGTMLGLVWNEWYVLDRIGQRASLYHYTSKDPHYDYAQERPDLLRELQRKARSMYFVGNDMILNRKVVY